MSSPFWVILSFAAKNHSFAGHFQGNGPNLGQQAEFLA
jgi:hypothetical protein